MSEEFGEIIKIRNNLLYWAKKEHDWHKKEDYLNDGECHTFEPLFKPDDKIIQVKIFYGTRDEGVLKGYHHLTKEAYKKFLEKYNARKK